jgi:hypothetical protein
MEASFWVEKAMVRGLECSLTKSTAVYNPKYDPCVGFDLSLGTVASMLDDERRGKAVVWRNATRDNPQRLQGAA